MRCTFQPRRLLRIIWKDLLSSLSWPSRPLLMPNWSGGSDPQPISVIQSGVCPSLCSFITRRNSRSAFSTLSSSEAYGCRAATSKLPFTLPTS